MLGGMDEHGNPTHYEIHVRGRLSDRLLSAFPDLRARTRNNETLLTGGLPDQAALHGVLTCIEALGLELLEVRRVRTQPEPTAEADEPRTRAPKRADERAGQSEDSDDQAAADAPQRARSKAGPAMAGKT